MDLLLKPARIATSKPARRTYLNTILFMIASGILLCTAITAYILFYLNYIPQISVESVIHLTYSGAGFHPYGTSYLSNAIVAQQAYDITLFLHLPRSPPNLERGNFMVSLSLLPSTYTPSLKVDEIQHKLVPPADIPEEVVFSSSRSCILTYSSRLVSVVHRVLNLPLYLLGLRFESELLAIPMGEKITFQHGRDKLPAYTILQIQAGNEIQIYDARIHFKARFQGIRWLMYNHRIISFVLFTTTFWFFEVLFAALTWTTMSLVYNTKSRPALEDEAEHKKIKREGEEPGTEDEPDLSDTPRTFPTSYWKKPPLRYEPKVEDEEIEAEAYLVDERDIKLEADDEDDGLGELDGLRPGAKTDSGIGTSFSEGGESSRMARRRSRGGKGGSS